MQFEVNVSDVAGITLQLRSYSQVIHAANVRLPWDNLSAHKVDGVAEAIKAAKAKIRYLPPYSPDLNPIELLFSKIKSMLRSEGNRTVETLWTSLGKIMNKIAPTECMNFIKHCGYKIFKLAATAN